MLENLKSYFSPPLEIKFGTVQKFISTDTNDKLESAISSIRQIINSNTKELVIVSFMGKARIGKSTLMNCYLSNLSSNNVKFFNTSNSTKEHCTNGIDILHVETNKHNLLLLDVQGLDFKDSKNDCKLMLFVFMISNIIVYCEKGILTNSVLSSFQTLTSLLTYIHDNHNGPKLIFRSIDVENDLDDYDPEENLNDMLTDLDDQYSNVRKSIKKLFSSIKCVPTYSLDKNEKKFLKENKFLNLLSNEDNGFQYFCKSLNEEIDTINNFYSIDNFDKLINTAIEQINNNQNIDFKILDLTASQAYISIKKWEDSEIDINKFSEIQVDGTQQNYNVNIVPIIDYHNKTMNNFDKLFSLTTPTIRDDIRDKINNKFISTITRAIERTRNIASFKLSNLLMNHVKIYMKNIYFDPSIDFTTWCDKVILPIQMSFLTYIDQTDFLDEIKSNYKEYLKYLINEKIKWFQTIHKKCQTDIVIYFTKIYSDLDDMIKNHEEHLFTVHISCVYNSFKKIISNISAEIYENLLSMMTFDVPSCCFTIGDIIDPNIGGKLNKVFDPSTFISFYDIDAKTELTTHCLNINILVKMFINLTINDSMNLPNISNILKKYSNYSLETHEYDITYLTGIIQKYLLTHEIIFKEQREQNLPNILKKIQKNNDSQIITNNYVLVKKHHIEYEKIYSKLIEGENNVKFLDILNYLTKYFDHLKITGSERDSNTCLIRYIYLLKNTDIISILTVEEFKIKYEKIIPYYNQLISNVPHSQMSYLTILNYELVKEIVDILFREHIMNR